MLLLLIPSCPSTLSATWCTESGWPGIIRNSSGEASFIRGSYYADSDLADTQTPEQKRIYIYIYMYRHTYIYIYIYTCTHTCIYIYIYVLRKRYIHTRTCVYIYIYTHMYMCVHMYIYIHTHKRSALLRSSICLRRPMQCNTRTNVRGGRVLLTVD